ncbi:hypothetical protein CCAE64S_00141 [Castellaniella caeni]
MALADALVHSGSQPEDSWWGKLLGDALDKALSTRQGQAVETALDQLLDSRSPAYEVLVEHAEAHSESILLSHEGQTYEALLVSAPLLAWTRYQLPPGQLDATHIEQLSALLRTAVLQADTRLALLPELIRFDQLPQSFRETRNWVQAAAQQALGIRREAPIVRPADIPDDLLADAYFLMGVAVVPQGQPVFQWQTRQPDQPPTRDTVAAQWAQGCAGIVEALFTGCQVEYLPPEAFYSSTRQADQGIRPLTLKSAITWLQTAAHLPANELRAAIVACGEQSAEEYRIGFCTRQNNDVIYGCVWPSLNREEAALEQGAEGQVDTWDTLAALLRESGIQDVRRLPGLQPLEFCEDCGTPYFPNMLGEMQHPELPEEIDPAPVQFH